MTIRKISPAEVASETGTLTLPPAGLPSRNPTKSYWLRDPSAALLGHRSTPELPETADVVVVGSGITGAFAARFLKDGLALHGRVGGGDQSVLMLEAREACSGATGRVSRLHSWECLLPLQKLAGEFGAQEAVS